MYKIDIPCEENKHEYSFPIKGMEQICLVKFLHKMFGIDIPCKVPYKMLRVNIPCEETNM